MSDKNSLAKQDRISDILAATTGLAQQDHKYVLASVGRVAQAARKGRFVEQLKEEWEQLRSSGAIDDEFAKSDHGEMCLLSVFEYVEHGDPSKEAFRFVKTAFFRAASAERDPSNDWITIELIKISTMLNANEIRVLAGCYTYDGTKDNGYHTWRKNIVDHANLVHTSIVDVAYKTLVEKGLLMPRTLSDLSGMDYGKKNGLTSLGLALCQLTTTETV